MLKIITHEIGEDSEIFIWKQICMVRTVRTPEERATPEPTPYVFQVYANTLLTVTDCCANSEARMIARIA